MFVIIGAAEYSASYISKQDEADVKQLRNLVIRKFSQLMLRGDSSLRSRTKEVGKAVLSSYKVGSVQACYKLLGLKHVISSRNVISIKSVKRSEMNIGLNLRGVSSSDTAKDGVDGTASVLLAGVGTHIGRRDCYGKLVQQQKSLRPDSKVEITLHSLISAYELKPDTKENRGVKPISSPEFFKLDAVTGMI